METDILLSIVIPVYNVQNYIGKCLNSLKTSDNRIEILVVDDGSPDESCEVIKNYEKNYPNIYYIKKENKLYEKSNRYRGGPGRTYGGV